MGGQRHPETDGSGFLERSISRRHLLKRLAAMTAAGAVLPLAAACASAPLAAPTPPPAAAGKPAGTAAPAAQPAGELKKGGSLKVATLGEPPALDIMFTTATITRNTAWHMFETLYAPNSKMEPQPLLAEKGDVSGDAKTWTFSLRKGIQFHNGKEMKAADVVASLKRWGAMGARGQVIANRLETISAKGYSRYSARISDPASQGSGSSSSRMASDGVVAARSRQSI